jgi:hypothetical protein
MVFRDVDLFGIPRFKIYNREIRFMVYQFTISISADYHLPGINISQELKEPVVGFTVVHPTDHIST